ncbi:MAG: MFS transporter [Patescibacteria group bacterium]
MPTLHHFIINIKRYGNEHKPLYYFSVMILFFVIFDGIMTFLVPVTITDAGISESTMGMIIGSSSIAGIIFDFFLCWLFRNSNYKRILLVMIIIAALFPYMLWRADSIFLFLIAMAIWGFYFDLLSISTFDFIGKRTPFAQHAASFGIVQFFQALGYLIAPLLVGFVIGETLGIQPFIMAGVFLAIALVLLSLLPARFAGEQQTRLGAREKSPITIRKEFFLWKKIGRYLLPVLALTIYLEIISGAVWTLGPLLNGDHLGLPGFSSYFLFAFELPFLIVGWLIGILTKNRSKKRIAYTCLIIGGLLLGSLNLFTAPLLLLVITFLASICIAMSWPAINGAYADYISETEKYRKEIESLEDFSMNIGFIIGPTIAGFGGAAFGHLPTIGTIGLIGSLVGVLLLVITPREIKIKIR